jgi:hypothetical protein
LIAHCSRCFQIYTSTRPIRPVCLRCACSISSLWSIVHRTCTASQPCATLISTCGKHSRMLALAQLLECRRPVSASETDLTGRTEQVGSLKWAHTGGRRTKRWTMERTPDRAQSRRHFLSLTAVAAISAVSPRVLCAGQRETGEPLVSLAVSAGLTTFEDVWRTVRDRFYDPRLHGLDWSAVRERYLPDAARATSEEALAGVINSMLSELHASHTLLHAKRSRVLSTR